MSLTCHCFPPTLCINDRNLVPLIGSIILVMDTAMAAITTLQLVAGMVGIVVNQRVLTHANSSAHKHSIAKVLNSALQIVNTSWQIPSSMQDQPILR